jgi:hypothetical protein
MKRAIFNITKNSINIRKTADFNKMKAGVMKATNQNKNLQQIMRSENKTSHNKVFKRSFSSFSQIPPPEDPKHLLFMIAALSVAYIITKKY